MSMLQIHKSALEEIVVPFHEFLQAQNKKKRQIFGFVEGKDDPSYYQGHITSILQEGWTVRLIEAGCPNGNKDRVLEMLKIIDWNKYPKRQTLFFVDRDLSEFLSESLPSDDNLYITDMYSIENYIVSEYTLERTLRELYNISLYDYELAIVFGLFQEGLNCIQELMSSIISWYLYWHKNGKKPDFNSINMSDLVTVNCCKVQLKEIDLNEYVNGKWGLENHTVDLSTIKGEFRSKDGQNKFIRGKNLMWFFVTFINSFCETCDTIIPRLQASISGCRQLNTKDAIKDLGPRTKIPESLKAFLERTCIAYINEIEDGVA